MEKNAEAKMLALMSEVWKYSSAKWLNSQGIDNTAQAQ